MNGGTVVGGYPRSDPETPENMATTIYNALGIPATPEWREAEQRPHHVYHGEPIKGLM